ncbi:MarR family winged helix-turn-helix transcriptional regulator [Actibacterium sp. 188UL27-1]|uniref:MarR family winged helix-turn-helix transcriptional regulator n=1 Tax=Actibacterium sp. 188UL27-1 TaxID=2786961 RepID=UPI001956D37E|nr:helix-turn-helix domain-containing protein [Actibacterium sp. 188UL27-1]MBM7069133.1 MarR family transcriptional regulator [Actibacterium sp. 188UL27-1]
MVNEIDEKWDDLRPDHIGVRLWEAAQHWKDRYLAEMKKAGHGWQAEARGSITAHIHPDGTRQAEIAQRMPISKQAVHQLIAELESQGIVTRDLDPSDGRGRIIRFTEAGLAVQRDGARIKGEIHDQMRTQMGAEAFDRLYALLGAAVKAPEENR